MYKLHSLRWLCLISGAFTLLFACQPNVEVPDINDFMRQDRERLGDLLHERFQRTEKYRTLPQTAPYDSLYWFTQTLYDQATAVHRRDLNSPANNRWNMDRKWLVRPFQDTSRVAFVLPGGYLYISTGMLQSIERDYELFALMSFESTLMEQEYLLEEMVRRYNSITLRNVVSGSAPANETTLNIMVEELPDFIFESVVVSQIDELTIENICQTSLYDYRGMGVLASRLYNENTDYFSSRISYADRLALLENYAATLNIDCGTLTGTSQYEKFVLEVLE